MNTKFQFRAGMRYAKRPEVYEIAHIVEHLAFGANAKYNSEQAFEADFTKNGAYHNAWTSDFSVCYESECADFEWDRIMRLQQVAIAQPRFNDEELQSEKGNVRAELTGYMNDYARLLWPRLQQLVGENVPDLQERIKTISGIELKDIREHYRRTHTAHNLRFIIAGNLRHRRHKILRMLEDWDLRPGERFEIPTDDLHSSAPVLIRRKDASNITFAFTWLTPRKLEPSEVYAMNCLNHILNGTMSSKILGQARKHGLVYGMGSDLSNGWHNASWDFDGEVNLESSTKLFDLIHKELNNVLNGEISDEDIAAAKSYAIGRYQMGAQTVSQISDYYADGYFTNGTIEKYDRMSGLVKKTKKSTMVDLAREFIGSEISALVAVSSVEKAAIVELADRLHF
jgi:predicted Zn-dependent peptidase